MLKYFLSLCALLMASALMLPSAAFAQSPNQDLLNALKYREKRIGSTRPAPIPAAPVSSRRVAEEAKGGRSAADAGPNDPGFTGGYQWSFKPLPAGMNAVGAWQKTTGAKDIVVAVLGSGILPKHPDNAGSPNILPGYSFVSFDGEQRKPDATDPGKDCDANWKATFDGAHMAGMIGSVQTNNGIAISGLNWSVSVLPIRVVSKCRIALLDLYQAMLWAVGYPIEGLPANQHPANVLLVNVQMQDECTREKYGDMIDVIEAVRAKGAVVVVPAGDSASDVKTSLPANCPGAISVAASDGKGHIASYSNFGAVSLMAPGGDPATLDPAGRKAFIWSIGKDPQMLWGLAGTGPAAAHVSGAIALALALHPDWRGNANVIEQKLRACAVPASAAICPKGCGSGQLDAGRLVEATACAAGESASASSRAASAPAPAPEAAEAPAQSPAPAPAPAPGGNAPRAPDNPMVGQWLLPDGEGILVITAKGEWLHPKYGAARVREANDDADIKVYYSSGGVRCSYRTSFADDGKTFLLSPADPVQDSAYCPAGELKSTAR